MVIILGNISVVNLDSLKALIGILRYKHLIGIDYNTELSPIKPIQKNDEYF